MEDGYINAEIIIGEENLYSNLRDEIFSVNFQQPSSRNSNKYANRDTYVSMHSPEEKINGLDDDYLVPNALLNKIKHHGNSMSADPIDLLSTTTTTTNFNIKRRSAPLNKYNICRICWWLLIILGIEASIGALVYFYLLDNGIMVT